jgi:carbonic anhydrase
MLMRKVFHFDSPRDKYHCDAAIVWCFDNRFENAFSKFLKRNGIIYADPIKIAGGAKSLASPELQSDREFILEQIRKSIRLHSTRQVILMVHSDCGAYGGLDGAFGGDPKAEAAFLQKELEKAAKVVQGAIPGIAVAGYFVDFEGVWDASVTAEGAPAYLSA